ncbi:MAG: NAD(P)/FAD-dependent oxidoreductase [Marinicaulis sp.]|nr:NAD(P)/FAD-dependent oxidoreductase [Marinicaulis sp.]
MPDAGSPKETPLDVLIIGAGFAGVCAAIKLREAGIENFRIFEKSMGVGGTWYDNTYPGAVCDVPSHLYCFSFEPNPNWSRVYSPQAEIRTYIEHCADKYGVRPFIENGRRINELRLDEASGLWRVHFDDGAILSARHIINCSGGLHEPNMPDLKGREKFPGIIMHTARWDHDVDFTGKRVAIIGSAASAIQIAPELAKKADNLTIFQRTPNYIVQRGDRAYSNFTKNLFAAVPALAKLYRWFIFMRLELMIYPAIKKGSSRGAFLTKQIIRHMRDVVDDPALQERLIPAYDLGCKRVLVSDDFYQTLNRKNVELIPCAVDAFTKDGLLAADGVTRDFDIVVCATGYDFHSHMISIDVVGEGGRRLSEEWADMPEAYKGACVAGYPNYYLATGPNTGVGTTSVVYMLEQQMKLIVPMIKASRSRLVSVRREAQDKYNREIQAALAETVWAAGGCKAWYQLPDGRISTLYPFNARTFAKQQSDIVLDDFETKEVIAPAT